MCPHLAGLTVEQRAEIAAVLDSHGHDSLTGSLDGWTIRRQPTTGMATRFLEVRYRDAYGRLLVREVITDRRPQQSSGPRR
jgi:hypothetical protein